MRGNSCPYFCLNTIWEGWNCRAEKGQDVCTIFHAGEWGMGEDQGHNGPLLHLAQWVCKNGGNGLQGQSTDCWPPLVVTGNSYFLETWSWYVWRHLALAYSLKSGKDPKCLSQGGISSASSQLGQPCTWFLLSQEQKESLKLQHSWVWWE